MTSVICKCCGRTADPFASIDFSRTCEDQHAPVFPPSREMVAYYRCPACGFVFTPHFDRLTSEQMADTIYNDQYVLADPGFVDARPRYFSGMLQDILVPVKDRITALDFGGGQGLLAALMREAGFSRFASYDPFFGGAGVAASSCDLVTAFEVMEHTCDPIGTFREALAPLRPDGTLLFSTVLQPRQPDQSWWYMAPRNGHVSLHSRRSLTVIARSLGMTFLPLDGGVHLFYRSPPSQVTQAIVQRRARQIMRFASLCGVGPWLDTAWQVARSGSMQATLDPRHPARALLATLGRPMER